MEWVVTAEERTAQTHATLLQPGTIMHLLLVDPVVASLLPALDLALVKPQCNLLLSGLNGVRAVADVATDIDGEVTTDSAGGRGQGVGGTEDDATSLHDITALPYHGGDGAATHVGNKTLEERLLAEVGVVVLKVLLGGSDKLDCDQLEASLLEAADDLTNESTLDTVGLDSDEAASNVSRTHTLMIYVGRKTVGELKSFERLKVDLRLLGSHVGLV